MAQEVLFHTLINRALGAMHFKWSVEMLQMANPILDPIHLENLMAPMMGLVLRVPSQVSHTAMDQIEEIMTIDRARGSTCQDAMGEAEMQEICIQLGIMVECLVAEVTDPMHMLGMGINGAEVWSVLPPWAVLNCSRIIRRAVLITHTRHILGCMGLLAILAVGFLVQNTTWRTTAMDMTCNAVEMVAHQRLSAEVVHVVSDETRSMIEMADLVGSIVSTTLTQTEVLLQTVQQAITLLVLWAETSEDTSMKDGMSWNRTELLEVTTGHMEENQIRLWVEVLDGLMGSVHMPRGTRKFGQNFAEMSP